MILATTLRLATMVTNVQTRGREQLHFETFKNLVIFFDGFLWLLWLPRNLAALSQVLNFPPSPPADQETITKLKHDLVDANQKMPAMIWP